MLTSKSSNLRDYSLTIFILLFHHFILSQNLIPDQGFEIISSTSNGNRPDVSFDNLELWYALDLNPDLFTSSCPFEESDFIFWSESTVAAEGSNYIGLWSRWNSDETYKTEGIAIELSEALVAGKTYSLSMEIFNRGEFQGLISTCVLKPDKHIDIYLSNDSIMIENDLANGFASTSATLVSNIRTSPVTVEESNDWESVNTCFIAEGGETFIAIILPLGDFGELPPCAGSMGTSGVFRSFYYFIDNVELIELAEDLRKDTLVCEGQDFIADLKTIFNSDILSNATFNWTDGFQGPIRTIQDTRQYQIEASTDCGIIPIDLEITSEDCVSQIYIPNTFSPNADDVNGVFQLFINNIDNISNYEIQIFDRWGGLVFENIDPLAKWDGRLNGNSLPNGIYPYLITYDILELGVSKKIETTGSVTIVR